MTTWEVNGSARLARVQDKELLVVVTRKIQVETKPEIKGRYAAQQLGREVRPSMPEA